MRSVLESAARKWTADKHLVNVDSGEWIPLLAEDGSPLPGIRGRPGAVADKLDGTEIGIDLIEMQPGSAFPLHTHPGDHLLVIRSGIGTVHINGQDIMVKVGDTVFIPAEYPHGVKGPPGYESEPLVLLAIGHPHKHVGASDRMHVVE